MKFHLSFFDFCEKSTKGQHLRMSMAIELLLPFGPKEFKRMPIIQ
jgi:hypothetical protein